MLTQLSFHFVLDPDVFRSYLTPDTRSQLLVKVWYLNCSACLQLYCMRDDELKDLGLPSSAIVQLKKIMSKIRSTNGVCSIDKRESVPNTCRKKQDAAAEVEQVTTGHYLWGLELGSTL